MMRRSSTTARSIHLRRRAVVALSLIACFGPIVSAKPSSPRSIPIADVLRQPLPAENLTLDERETAYVVHGPTFEYSVDRRTGMISQVAVRRDGKEVLSAPAPLSLRFDDY